MGDALDKLTKEDPYAAFAWTRFWALVQVAEKYQLKAPETVAAHLTVAATLEAIRDKLDEGLYK